MLLVYFQRIGTHVEGDIGHMQKVIGKVLLDHVTLVAQTNDEVVYTMVSINLEDMPKYWHAADFDHGLGA